MNLHATRWFLAPLALAVGMCEAQVSDLSGTWHLSVQKSRWGKMRKPASVVLQIEHREPLFKYSGVVVYTHDETRHFTFDGAIDGKAYPGQRSYGPGAISIKRVNASTVVSAFRSGDGQYLETAEVFLSPDGKVLTQRMSLVCPEGKRTWTETYEKK